MPRTYPAVRRATPQELAERQAAERRKRWAKVEPDGWERRTLRDVAQAARDGNQDATDALWFAAMGRKS